MKNLIEWEIKVLEETKSFLGILNSDEEKRLKYLRQAKVDWEKVEKILKISK